MAGHREPADVLAALAGGDPTAGERLVEDSYRQIYAALVRLCGDPELAADLTQETYRKAWAALPRFKGEAQLSTWLYRIAYTTFLKHLRHPRPVDPLPAAGEGFDPPDPEPPIDHEVAAREEGSLLRRAVVALPEPLRFVVTAHYWGEMPVREIARLESITTVAVRKRLKKAFGALRVALDQEVAS